MRTLRDEDARGGVNTVAWYGSDDHGRALPAGVYLYRLEAAGIRSVQRTLLLR